LRNNVKKYLCSIAILAIAAFGNANASNKDTIRRVIFMQPCAYATLQSTKQTHTYTLTLKLLGDNPQVVYVSEHPHRDAGTIPVAKFLSGWNEHPNSFSNKPPMAALVYEKFKADKPYGVKVDMMQITKPKLDSKNSTLTYEVQTTGGYTLQSGTYTSASLLIDRIVDIG
jgi:hypothetical protein